MIPEKVKTPATTVKIIKSANRCDQASFSMSLTKTRGEKITKREGKNQSHRLTSSLTYLLSAH